MNTRKKIKKELAISFRTYGEYIGFRIRPLSFPENSSSRLKDRFHVAIDCGWFAIVIQKFHWT